MSHIHSIPVLTKEQGPVVRKVDNSIHWINTWVSVQNPVDSTIRFPNIFPLIVIHRLNNRDQKHANAPKHD